MKNNILIIDSDYEEAQDFVKGLRDTTNTDWSVLLYENNKIYGIRRYIKFFTVAWQFFLQRRKYKESVILCWQQFYGIILAFFCKFFHVKKQFNIIIMTFIYKPKKGILGKIFFRFVKYAITSKYVDQIVCTSKKEISNYSRTFGLKESKFSFVKWGSIDYEKRVPVKKNLQSQKYVFSTGRSNRDYDFLIDTIEKTNYTLIIACDELNRKSSDNIMIYDNLYGEAMLEYMKNAWCVVISLKDDMIASGQLVLLQAMNLGVPVIITESHGVTDDYVINEYNGLIIKKQEKKCKKKQIILKTKEI